MIVFMLTDILAQDVRVTRWRLGRGRPRPDGAYSFPVILESAAGRFRGELLTARPPDGGWGVELAIIEKEDGPASAEQTAGAFDPTLLNTRRTER